MNRTLALAALLPAGILAAAPTLDATADLTADMARVTKWHDLVSPFQNDPALGPLVSRVLVFHDALMNARRGVEDETLQGIITKYRFYKNADLDAKARRANELKLMIDGRLDMASSIASRLVRQTPTDKAALKALTTVGNDIGKLSDHLKALKKLIK